MAVINNVDYDFFGLEILQPREIRINSTTNNVGILNYDENNNLISGNQVGIGRQDIISMTSNTNGNIILYNDESKYFQFLDLTFTEDENENYYVYNTRLTNKYKVRATRYESTTITSNKITVDLTGESVFKVIVNGYDIESYSYDATGVTITGDDVYYVGEFVNYAIVYHYDSNQAISGETIFEYHAPEKFYTVDKTLFNDGSFFNKDDISEICLFENFNVNDERTLWQKNRAYKYNQKQRQIDRKISIAITNKEDIRDTVGDNYFRFFGWSKKYERFLCFNNCIIQGSANMQKTKLDPNTYSYDIMCEDYYVLDFLAGAPYGTSLYGLAPYGGVFDFLVYM